MLQMEIKFKKWSNYKWYISEVFHLILLISFSPITSADVTSAEFLAFKFLDHVKFGNVAVNICKENL